MLKLDHIIVAVENLEDKAKQWAQMLGIAPVWSGHHPKQGTANVLFNFGDFYLELMAGVGEGSHGERVRRFISQRGEGVMGLCLHTDDIEATAQAWQAAGLSAEVSAGEGQSGELIRKWKLAIAPLEQTQGLFLFAIEHLSAPLPLGERQPASAESLDHAVIMTAAPDEMRAFLEKAIGLRVGLDRTREDYNMRQIFFSLGNKKFLEVAQPLKGGAVETSFWGLTWRVQDIEAAHQRLTAHGFTLSPVRQGRREGTKVFTLRDAPSSIPTLILAN